MAFVRPPLVVDTTGTPGTGTYTLDDPAAPGDGFRTLADAVADGDASAGDTISYFVVDTTTTAAALEWEHGTGTIGAGGLSLARTSVISSSNGGSEVSWGSGGSRTVRFGAGTAGFALLAAAQTFTAAQIFSAGLTSNTAILVEAGASVGQVSMRSDRTAGVTALIDFVGHDSAGNNTAYADLRATIVDATNGSEDGLLDLLLMKAGTQTTCFRFSNDGTITDQANARTFAYQGVLSAPSGTKMVFKQATPPAGWTKDTADNDAALRVVSGTPGASGGSRGLSATAVGGTSLTEAQLASHDHDINKADFAVDSGTTAIVLRTDLFTGSYTTQTAGSGDSHDHALALKYVDVIIASKT